MKLSVIIFVFALFFAGCTNQSARQEKHKRPNVVIIIADDMGWADIGYNNPRVYTPNLDKLATSGARFVNHYVMPQCTPTRVAFMTGRYPGRFGPTGLHATNEPVFPVGTPTLAKMFQDNRYNTFMSGKWHLGSIPESGPNHFGFDESHGSLTGAVGMYDHRYHAKDDTPYDPTWHRNHTIIPGFENGASLFPGFAEYGEYNHGFDDGGK
jgi:arylsulfatase A-like enzyme